MKGSEFNALAEAALLSIEQQVEDADTELDFEMSSGILTLTAENGSKIIINRQVATLEIWVAARSGGYHLVAKAMCGFAKPQARPCRSC